MHITATKLILRSFLFWIVYRLFYLSQDVINVFGNSNVNVFHSPPNFIVWIFLPPAVAMIGDRIFQIIRRSANNNSAFHFLFLFGGWMVLFIGSLLCDLMLTRSQIRLATAPIVTALFLGLLSYSIFDLVNRNVGKSATDRLPELNPFLLWCILIQVAFENSMPLRSGVRESVLLILYLILLWSTWKFRNRFPWKSAGNQMGWFILKLGASIALSVFLLVGIEKISRMYIQNETAPHATMTVPTNVEKIDQKELKKKRAILRSENSGQMEPAPWVIWKSAPRTGKLINVDHNNRRVTAYNSDDKGAKKVFVFGGSTVWGIGAEDKETIPSFLAKELNKSGRYHVTNMGVSAYFSTQETIDFYIELVKGNVPDIAVFYDGTNDVYVTGYSPGDPAKFHGYERWLDFQTKHFGINDIIREKWRRTNVHKVFETIGWIKKNEFVHEEIAEFNVNEKADRVVESYLRNIAVIEAICKRFSIEPFFFWQPNLRAGPKKHLGPLEEKALKESPPKLIELYKQTYARMAEKKPKNIVNLSRVFEETIDEVYIDSDHTEGRGNERIAKRISETILGLAY